MLLQLNEYHRPETWDQAMALLGRADVRTVPLAGGTDLLGRDDDHVQAVVDLAGLGLGYVRQDQAGLRIGAMATLQQLADELAGSPGALRAPGEPRDLAAMIGLCAQRSAPRTVRDQATVGGSIACGEPADDLIVALVAAGASLRLRTGGGERTEALETWLAARARAGAPANSPGEPQVIAEVLVGPPAASRVGAAAERVARTPSDRAIVTVAAWVAVDGGRCVDLAAAVGGVAPSPLYLGAGQVGLPQSGNSEFRKTPEATVEAALATLDRLVDGIAAPLQDHLGGVDYRRHAARVLLGRALRRAAAAAAGVTGGRT